MREKSLEEIDLPALCGREFYPSPSAWEDEVLYFLLLDRFSDGNEDGFLDNSGREVSGSTPRFSQNAADCAVENPQDAASWRDAGGKWVGGNLKGLESKIGYLKRLGVTAIWVSPIFKQVSFQETYHGYGIQNFLEVDPHFGTREGLKSMVETAHAHGIRVILDIILNHSGNVFSYDPDRYWSEGGFDPRWDGNPYRVKGFNDASGNPSLSFLANPDAPEEGAIWPVQFQDPSVFTGKGKISNWDYDPEYLDGDFCDLKDIHLGQGSVDEFQPSKALMALCEAYKFWIAYADLDGFRVDTVKHMGPGPTRFLNSVIHEFAQSLGKENFYLIGEITGGREMAFDILEQTGLDAALGISDIPDKLEYLVKGYRNPADYFDLFRNSLLVRKDSHVWFKNKVVTVFDDHDQVRKGTNKARFCAGGWEDQVLNVLALNAATLGIPCIYYGTEQGFDGEGGNDRYIRESMFGGNFGAFRSKDLHFFDETGKVYRELSKILEIRKNRIALRRGRQYLREISGDGVSFGFPEMVGGEIRSVVPWSRIFNDHEMLLAINTDSHQPRTAWMIVDNSLHRQGEGFTCLYSTDPAQIGQDISTVEIRPSTLAVQITVPAAGFVIYE